MTLAALIVNALALIVAAAAVWLALWARADAAATRNELARHRHSHTLQQPEVAARRHSTDPGPPPRVDEHAAPATGILPAQPGPTRLPPPGRRRVREDPQA